MQSIRNFFLGCSPSKLLNRQLSTASKYESAASREWLVILPDRPNVLSRRIAIRPKHSPNFVRLHNEGYVSWAGPVFEKHVGKETPQRPFKGSVMVVNEKDRENFLDKIRSDPYVQENIWDLEKTQFLPFRTVMRA